MDTEVLRLVNWVVAVVAIVVAIKLCIWFAKYSLQIEYVKMEIKRSLDIEERARWKRELSALRWSILPGMTRRRYFKLYRFFHRQKGAS